MARIARIVLPRQPHLISQAARKPVFHAPQRRQMYLDILSGCASMYRMKLLAWSVLPQRVMLVAVPPTAEAMGGFMRVAHARFTRRLRADGLKGEVTPSRFASCPLDAETALEAIKYVESMPVLEGLAETPLVYPFGSAALRVAGDGHLLVHDHVVTSSVDDWTAWHAEPLPEHRADYLALRMRTGKPAGAAPFVRRVERRLGMNLSRSRGRPPQKKA